MKILEDLEIKILNLFRISIFGVLVVAMIHQLSTMSYEPSATCYQPLTLAHLDTLTHNQ